MPAFIDHIDPTLTPSRPTFQLEPYITLRERVEEVMNSIYPFSYNEWLNILSHDGWMINKMPKNFYTYEAFLTTVKKYGSSIKLLFKNDYFLNRMTDDEVKEVCWEAVIQSGYALRYIPPSWIKMIGKPLCETAVKKYGRALEYVPEEFQDNEMYKNAINDRFASFKFVPYPKRSLSLCQLAFSKCVWNFEHIPDPLKGEKISADPNETKNFCDAAVKVRGEYIQYVPTNLRTPEMLEDAKKYFREIPEFSPYESLRNAYFNYLKATHGIDSSEMIGFLYGSPSKDDRQEAWVFAEKNLLRWEENQSSANQNNKNNTTLNRDRLFSHSSDFTKNEKTTTTSQYSHLQPLTGFN